MRCVLFGCTRRCRRAWWRRCSGNRRFVPTLRWERTTAKPCSRSDAEFVSKIEGALQEIEETRYWLELLVAAEVLSPDRLQSLLNETDELTAILVTCAKRTKARKAALPAGKRTP